MSNSNLDCWVCGAPSDRWELVEARLCENCRNEPARSLQRVGVTTTSRKVDDEHTLIVEAPDAIAPRIYLVFGPESLTTMVKKLLKPEVELQQRDWDDKVFLEYAETSYVPLLEAPEVNGLIERLVEHGRVELCNERAEVTLLEEQRSVDDVALMVASLMHAIRDVQD